LDRWIGDRGAMAVYRGKSENGPRFELTFTSFRTNYMQVVKVMVWEDNGTWLAYLQEYPDYWTQGETQDELREHLKDLYREFVGGQVPGIRKVEDLVVA
jgi:predicted RNase H-like HicB family nuclease